MRRILLILAALLVVAGDAWAEPCVSSGDGTWSGAVGATGSATWTGCTPTADDNYSYSHDIQINAEIGASGAPMTGKWTALSGGDLTIDPNVVVYHSGEMEWLDGSQSTGIIQGEELLPMGAPAAITFTDTTIQFDFRNFTDPDGDDVDEVALPNVICNSSCDETTIHAASAGDYPPTMIYIDFEKAGRSSFPEYSDTLLASAFPFTPGIFLEVTAVADLNVDTIYDAFTVTLPSTGSTYGARHFGADGTTTVTTPDGDGRCEECTDDAAGAPNGAVDTSGTLLRNAVNEGRWTVATPTAGAPARRVTESTSGKQRFEIYIDPADAPFNSNREFEGFLVCRGSDASDPSTENWCARIIKTIIDDNDCGNAGDCEDDTGAGETIVVWRDPRNHVLAGDELNVYYARPTEGDKLVPFNPVRLEGDNESCWDVQSGSGLFTDNAVSGIHVHEGGPDGNNGSGCDADSEESGAYWRIENQAAGNWTLDLALFENMGGEAPDAETEFLETTYHIRWGSTGGPAIENAADLSLTRFSYRFPDLEAFVGADTTDRAQQVFAWDLSCVGADVDADTCEPEDIVKWTDANMSKIRIEGAISGWIAGQGPHWTDCEDGVILQDYLNVHSRSIIDNTAGKSEEMIEWGSGDGCSVDRAAVLGGTAGAPAIVRCRACDELGVSPNGGPHLTSYVAFGINDAVANAVSSSANAVGLVFVSNWMTDGKLNPDPTYTYGSRMDYYVQGSLGHYPGVRECNDSVGIFLVGLSGSVTFDSNMCDGKALDMLDYYIANVDASAGTFSMSLTTASWTVAPTMRFENILFHVAIGSDHSRFVHFNGLSPGIPELIFDNWVYIKHLASNQEWIDIRSDAITANSLQVGPNVYGVGVVGSLNVECDDSTEDVFDSEDNCVVADAFALTGDGAADTGIIDEDAGTIGISGVFAGDNVGNHIRLLGFDGTEPAACSGAYGPCNILTAMPRHAGVLKTDEWPFVWATVDPVPVFRRTTPRREYIPTHLVKRLMGVFDGGGGGDSGGAF